MKMMKQYFGVALLLLMITLLGGGVDAQDTNTFATVSGTVTYSQKIALPDNAEIVVQLSDVARADAPAKVIASETISANGRQVPFDFTLSYETASIDATGTYTVSAGIYIDDNLAWISDTAYPVINNGQFTADITLTQVSAAESATEQAAMTEESPASFGTITGTISYLQRIALPDDAVVQVELADVSRADAPAFVLASQQFIANGRQVPFAFSLSYDTNGIRDNGTYTVSAKIYVDGAMRWTSDTSNPVISNGVTSVDVQLVQVGG